MLLLKLCDKITNVQTEIVLHINIAVGVQISSSVLIYIHISIASKGLKILWTHLT